MRAMKFSRNRIAGFLIILLLQAISSCVVQSQEHARFFGVELAPEKVITIKLESKEYWVRFREEKWTLLKSEVVEGGGAKEVIFMDANKNGLNDIFLKLFEAGSNSFYALFITAVKDGSVVFTEFDGLFGSPYINDHGELISVKRVGPFSRIEIFKAEQGELYRHKIIEPLSSDLERVTKIDRNGETKFSINFLGDDTPATACVSVNRAFLSRSPTAADVTKAYIVKGDGVSLLDSTDSGEWLKVRYQGKSITEGWVLQEMLSFNEPNQCVKSE